MSIAFKNHHVPVYFCLSCNISTTNVETDAYGDHWCPNCQSDRVTWESERPPAYVTVAVYECDRAYGGPEEGGWYYDCGDIIPGTERSFLAEDEPQFHVYKELLNTRWPGREYHIRVMAEAPAERGFPHVAPRYC